MKVSTSCVSTEIRLIGIPLRQALGSVHRNRPDILPYYGRLVGTLNPYMPDIGKELVAVVSDRLGGTLLNRVKQSAETLNIA